MAAQSRIHHRASIPSQARPPAIRLHEPHSKFGHSGSLPTHPTSLVWHLSVKLAKHTNAAILLFVVFASARPTTQAISRSGAMRMGK